MIATQLRLPEPKRPRINRDALAGAAARNIAAVWRLVEARDRRIQELERELEIERKRP